jgi:hypothetical protein
MYVVEQCRDLASRHEFTIDMNACSVLLSVAIFEEHILLDP